MVDLPLAERPVNHNVKPFWPRRVVRSRCVTDEGCHVILLTNAEALAWVEAMLSRRGACAHVRSHCGISKSRCVRKVSCLDWRCVEEAFGQQPLMSEKKRPPLLEAKVSISVAVGAISAGISGCTKCYNSWH